jgi:hypothetical protein
MTNHVIGGWIAAVCLAMLLYAATGCNESTILGRNLVPDSELIHTQETDTFTILARTVYRPDDSLVSNYQTVMAAGATTGDPVFGKTTAITYAQFGLLQSGFSYEGTGQVLDSVVLSVAYAGYYGDSLGKQQYTVYRIKDPEFNDTTLYYTHQQLAIDHGNPLGTATASAYGLQDSVSVWGIKEAPQLRIRLSNAFGNELLQQSASGAFANDSAFHIWLNGLALVPDSATGGRKSLIYLGLNSDYTGISVYYHNSTDDSLQAFFPFNVQTCAFANYIHRDYTGSVAEQHFGDTTSLKGDSLIFLQSNPGLYANIDIPYLQNFPNAIINKAELIMTQIPDAASDIFTAPDYLFLWKYKGPAKDTLGYIYDVGAVIDPVYGTQLTNLSYFGGARKTITNSSGERVAQYRINITRYLQHLLRANPSYPETNYGFRLVVRDASGNTPDIGRVVLGGGYHSNYALKLHVVYTKIK